MLEIFIILGLTLIIIGFATIDSIQQSKELSNIENKKVVDILKCVVRINQVEKINENDFITPKLRHLKGKRRRKILKLYNET